MRLSKMGGELNTSDRPLVGEIATVAPPPRLAGISSAVRAECSSVMESNQAAFPRFARFHAGQHGENHVAISASDLDEARLAHPDKLLTNRRPEVLLHALQRRIEIALGDLQFARPFDPEPARRWYCAACGCI